MIFLPIIKKRLFALVYIIFCTCLIYPITIQANAKSIENEDEQSIEITGPWCESYSSRLSKSEFIETKFGLINLDYLKTAKDTKLNLKITPNTEHKFKNRAEQSMLLLLQCKRFIQQSVFDSVSKILNEKLTPKEPSNKALYLSLNVYFAFNMKTKIELQFKSEGASFSGDFIIERFENYDAQVTGHIDENPIENEPESAIDFSFKMPNFSHFRSIDRLPYYNIPHTIVYTKNENEEKTDEEVNNVSPVLVDPNTNELNTTQDNTPQGETLSEILPQIDSESFANLISTFSLMNAISMTSNQELDSNTQIASDSSNSDSIIIGLDEPISTIGNDEPSISSDDRYNVILNIYPDGDLSMKNTIFSYPNFNGGGITVHSDAKITLLDNVSFLSFTQPYGYGAAIRINDDATADLITASTFSNNWAYNSSSISAGGAIYNAGTITSITDSTFSGNYVTTGRDSTYVSAMGGAIYNVGSIYNITNSAFIDNYAESTSNATTAGGAVWNSSSDELIMTDVLFTGNSAKYGGAIYNAGIISYIVRTNDLSITGNSADIGSFLYNEGTFSIIAESVDISIEDNIGDYAIYNSGILNLSATPLNNITINDTIYNIGTTNIYESTDVKLNNVFMRGNLNIDGTLTVAGANGAINSTDIVISDTGTLTISASSLINVICDNSGIVNLKTGTLTSEILGTGTIIIKENNTITSNADYLGNVVKNTGVISLTGGTMDYSINYEPSSSANPTLSSLGEFTTSGTIDVTVNTSVNENIAADLMVFHSTSTTSVTSLTLDTDVATEFNELELYLAIDYYIYEELKIPLYYGDTLNIAFDTVAGSYIYLYMDNTLVINGYEYLYEWYNDGDNAGILFLTSIPEPTTYAMILGTLALGFVMYRRRK